MTIIRKGDLVIAERTLVSTHLHGSNTEAKRYDPAVVTKATRDGKVVQATTKNDSPIRSDWSIKWLLVPSTAIGALQASEALTKLEGSYDSIEEARNAVLSLAN